MTALGIKVSTSLIREQGQKSKLEFTMMKNEDNLVAHQRNQTLNCSCMSLAYKGNY